MKTILYIGNRASKKSANPTTIDVLGKLLSDEGYKMILVSNKKNKILRFLEMCWGVVKHSKSVDYMLIDAYSTLNFWYLLATSQLARILKCNYIPILHGGNLPHRLNKNPKLCRLIFANAYKNIAPSNYLYQVFEKHGFQNLILIPNSITTKDYDFHPPKTLNTPAILWVRTFSELYNPLMALQVLHEIQKQNPNATLTMVGSNANDIFKACQNYAQKFNLNVTFTGKLEKKEWIKRAKNHNYFINTSHYDNMPVSVLEAMALGLPIISTRVGGIPHFLTHKENAMLIDDNSVTQMTEAIIYLSKNQEEVNKITQNARQFTETLDWNLIKKKWLDLLN